MMQKRWQRILIVAIILLLFSPLYFWFLINFYQTAIQIPGEWKQFRGQETSILNALNTFASENHHYPENIAQLSPDSVEEPIWQSENWSFWYRTDENGAFILQADLPKVWFGWPTRRVCRSQPDGSVTCNFYYICSYKQGTQWLSEPIQQDQPGRPLLGTGDVSPCVTGSN
jgi:hypothetical protein